MKLDDLSNVGKPQGYEYRECKLCTWGIATITIDRLNEIRTWFELPKFEEINWFITHWKEKHVFEYSIMEHKD